MTNQEQQDYDDSFLNDEHPLYEENNEQDPPKEYESWAEWRHEKGDGYDDSTKGCFVGLLFLVIIIIFELLL